MSDNCCECCNRKVWELDIICDDDDLICCDLFASRVRIFEIAPDEYQICLYCVKIIHITDVYLNSYTFVAHENLPVPQIGPCCCDKHVSGEPVEVAPGA